jgi:hypothetical protein
MFQFHWPTPHKLVVTYCNLWIPKQFILDPKSLWTGCKNEFISNGCKTPHIEYCDDLTNVFLIATIWIAGSVMK